MNYTSIARASTYFLQVLIIAVGMATLVGLLWEPHLEGRNAQATLFDIYFNDPFLAYVYIASIPFFVALYQVLKVLGYSRQQSVFSADALQAVRRIQYCAVTLAVLIFLAMVYIAIAMRGEDDSVGGMAMGIGAFCLSIIMAATAAVCERVMRLAANRS